MSRLIVHPTPEVVTTENFEAFVSQSKVPVLLEFWAPWCVPCNLMKRAVESAAKSLGREVRVGLVNVDAEPELVARYGVRGTPTFVLLRDEQVVSRFSGMATASGLVNRIRKSL